MILNLERAYKPFTRMPYRKIKEINCGKTKTDNNLFPSKR